MKLEKDVEKRFEKEFQNDLFEYIPAKWSEEREDGTRAMIPNETPRVEKKIKQFLAQEIQTAVQKERTDLISYLKNMLSNKMNDIVFTNWKAPIYALIGYLEPTTKDTKDVV